MKNIPTDFGRISTKSVLRISIESVLNFRFKIFGGQATNLRGIFFYQVLKEILRVERVENAL